MALGGNVGLSAGLSVNAWERFELKRAFDQEDGVSGATTKTNRSVPIFVGAGLKFGPKNSSGDKKYALGVSVVEPIFFAGGAFLKSRSPEIALVDTYEAAFKDRATWYGVSFAGRINRRHSLGAALNLSVRKLNHAETGLALAGGPNAQEVAPDVFQGVSSAANSQSLGFDAFHFVFRLGWMFQIKPQVKLGVMFQPPGIPLRQKVGVLSQGFINDNRDTSMAGLTEAYFVDGKVNANLPIPLELEAGVEYFPAENVLLALDASFHGPVRSSQRVELAQDVPIGGLFFDNDTRRLPTGNVALAGEFGIRRRVTIQTAFFTDFSSAAKIPDNPDRYYNPRVNRFGGTLSLGVHASGISLAVGSTVVSGRGHGTGVVLDTANLALGYERTQAISRAVYFHVTGVTGAAKVAGSKISRRMRKRSGEAKKPEQEAEEQGEETEDAGTAE